MPMQHDWEIWLDHHLSSVLAKRIADTFGWKVKSEYVLKLGSLLDEQILLRARDAGEVIILTKDIDFTDIMKRYGQPPKVLRLINANRKTNIIWQALEPVLEKHIRNLISFGQSIEIIDLKLS
jgi:predicted nuclease of predicted toxin-antitoxin system